MRHEVDHTKVLEEAKEAYSHQKNAFIKECGSEERFSDWHIETLNALEKIIHSDGMLGVWQSAARAKIYGGKITYCVSYAMGIGHHRTDLMSGDDHKKWKKKVRKKAKDLAELLQGTGYDDIVDSQFVREYREFEKDFHAHPLPQIHQSKLPTSVSRKYREIFNIITDIRSTDYLNHYEKTKPKKLSEYLVEISGSEEEDWHFAKTYYEPRPKNQPLINENDDDERKEAAALEKKKRNFKRMLRNAFRGLTGNRREAMTDVIADIIFSGK